MVRRRFRVVGSQNQADVFNDLEGLRREQAAPSGQRRQPLKETFARIPHDRAHTLARLRIGGPASAAMTSLERERHGPLHPALVRERLLVHFTARFGFSQTALFFDHPLLRRKVRADALATPS